MKFLVVETSSPRGGICFVEKKGTEHTLLFEKTWQRKQVAKKDRASSPSHSELVGQFVEEGLKKINLQLSDLDFFATSNGPGSFTGIRVGLNLVKTYCFSLQKPFYVLNSLKLLALNAPSSSIPICCITNAYKNQLYFAQYQWDNHSLVELTSPTTIHFDELSKVLKVPHLCLGDGYKVYEHVFSKEVLSLLVRDSRIEDYPNILNIAHSLASENNLSLEKDWKLLNPLYLRQSEAEENLRSGLLKPIEEL